MEKMLWYDVVCHTEGCQLYNQIVPVYGPEITAFACGPCGQPIDDWKISETQLT